MLYAVKPPSRRIESVERTERGLKLTSKYATIFVQPTRGDIFRVTATVDGAEIPHGDGLLDLPEFSDWDYSVTEERVTVSAAGLKMEIELSGGGMSWYGASGEKLLSTPSVDGVMIEKYKKYRVTAAKSEKIMTADGEKSVVRAADRVEDGFSCRSRLRLEFSDGEALYGLGQHEEGFLNLRGKTVYLHQANRKIAVPSLVSSLGWGILYDCMGAMIFNDTEAGSYIYCEAQAALDFYFINGGSPEGAVRGYRYLTGGAAMLPRWAFGYIQSQERYETEEEIKGVARAYRERGIGLDCVVLDWCSWGDGQWGQKTLDKNRFPDAEGMIGDLHKNHTHFMISVWPNCDEHCDNYREFDGAGLLLPNLNVYNAFSEAGRKMYWEQLRRELFRVGADAWWCDNSEPITPEWNEIERPEPARLFDTYCRETAAHIPPELSNGYGFYHALGVYDGQRAESPKKRVLNLTRSGSIGSQRLGTVMWSGDIAASWDTLTRQIAAGLNFCAAGHPYWTTDIGAFFVKRSVNWYWRGDFDGTVGDLGYRELFTRWYQWAAFLPMFRGHGTDCRRELWLFENAEDAKFYDAIIKANRLRYRLLPYIYSEAGKCCLYGGLIMRPLGFDFPEDQIVHTVKDQYMFGEAIMVAPVHEAMYYLPGSEKIDMPKKRRVYLPKNPGGWFDFNTGEHLDGGEWIEADAPLDTIPLYVRAGRIIPAAEEALSSEEQSGRLDIIGFGQGKYLLYDDEGDGYGYEKGEYRLTEIERDGEGNVSAKTLCGDKVSTKYFLDK